MSNTQQTISLYSCENTTLWKYNTVKILDCKNTKLQKEKKKNKNNLKLWT